MFPRFRAQGVAAVRLAVDRYDPHPAAVHVDQAGRKRGRVGLGVHDETRTGIARSELEHGLLAGVALPPVEEPLPVRVRTVRAAAEHSGHPVTDEVGLGRIVPDPGHESSIVEGVEGHDAEAGEPSSLDVDLELPGGTHEGGEHPGVGGARTPIDGDAPRQITPFPTGQEHGHAERVRVGNAGDANA